MERKFNCEVSWKLVLHAKGWDRLSDRQCLMHVRLPVHMQVLRAHMR